MNKTKVICPKCGDTYEVERPVCTFVKCIHCGSDYIPTENTVNFTILNQIIK